MKSIINRELLPVLEDVFVTEGIVDTFKGLAEKRSLRLAESYIKGSIKVINKNAKDNPYIRDIDKSKGDITKIPSYKDFKTIESKLNLMLTDETMPKSFVKSMNDLNKLSAFLYDNRKGILRQVYVGNKKTRTGQLIYIGMVVSLFYSALALIGKYGSYEGATPTKENTMMLRTFASKATVNDFSNLIKQLPDFEKAALTEDVVDAETGEEIKDEDDTTEDDDLDSIEDIQQDSLNATLDDISTPTDLAAALEEGKDDFLKVANAILLEQSRLGKVKTIEVKTLKLDEDTKEKMKFSNSLHTDTYISTDSLENLGFDKPETAVKGEIPEQYDQTVVLLVTYKTGSVAFATFDATKAYTDKLEDLKQFIFKAVSLYIKEISKIKKFPVTESLNMRFYRKNQLNSAILKEKLQESFFDEMKEIKITSDVIKSMDFSEAWDVNNKDEHMHPLAYNRAHEILLPQREFGEFLGFELKLAKGSEFGRLAKDVDGFMAANYKDLANNTILYADAKYTHKASFPVRLWIFTPEENPTLDVCESVVGDKVRWFINYLIQQNLKEVNDGGVNQYPVAEAVNVDDIVSGKYILNEDTFFGGEEEIIEAYIEEDDDEEELANNPAAPRFPENTTTVKELGYGEDEKPEDWKPQDEVTEGTIYALIGDDEQFVNEDSQLTEDSLKDFILGGVSKTGKDIVKGTSGNLNSENIKAFLSNGYTKGILVVGSIIALLFMIRYLVTLVCMMRVNLAEYLRETASIIDEQIDGVNNMKTRNKQEEISAKLKNLANKFDLDTNVASNKAERVNRDFDSELLDNFADSELAADSNDGDFAGGAFF